MSCVALFLGNAARSTFKGLNDDIKQSNIRISRSMFNDKFFRNLFLESMSLFFPEANRCSVIGEPQNHRGSIYYAIDH